MPTSVEELAAQAIKLSPEDRARLADILLASLPDETDPEVDAAWDQEIQRRVNEVRAGTASSRRQRFMPRRARSTSGEISSLPRGGPGGIPPRDSILHCRQSSPRETL